MALKSDNAGWGSLAQMFHWILALMIIGLGAVGWIMTAMATSPDKIKIYALHKSFGLTVLALALLRIVWRAVDRRPLDSPTMPSWQIAAARLVHIALYALMLAMPLSGWLFNSAANFPLQWFGLVSIPSLTGGADLALKGLARAAHYWLFWVLAVAFIAHVAGALKHHFVDRDDVLARMLPWLRRRLRSIEPPVNQETKVIAIKTEHAET